VDFSGPVKEGRNRLASDLFAISLNVTISSFYFHQVSPTMTTASPKLRC
jgi:hypothetical protein